MLLKVIEMFLKTHNGQINPKNPKLFMELSTDTKFGLSHDVSRRSGGGGAESVANPGLKTGMGRGWEVLVISVNAENIYQSCIL